MINNILINETINKTFDFNFYDNITAQYFIDTTIKECKNGNTYSMECLYKTVCPQMKDYYINMGMTLIISYMLVSWVSWWFFQKGYLKFSYTKNWDFETRYKWFNVVKDKFILAFMGYIIVVIYFNMKYIF